MPGARYDDSVKTAAFALFDKGLWPSVISDRLGISVRTAFYWQKQWRAAQDAATSSATPQSEAAHAPVVRAVTPSS